MFTAHQVAQWHITSARHVTTLITNICSVLTDNIKPDTINVLDIGSSTGMFLHLLDQKIPVNFAVLVEPIPEILEYAKQLFKDRNFIFVNKALSKLDSSMYMLLSDNENLGGNTLREHLPTNVNAEQWTVHSSFDTINDLNFYDYDLIKIDAENQDYNILEGMVPFIQKLNKKPLVVIEHQRNNNPEHYKELCTLMENCGYTIFDFYPNSLSTDIFFIPNDYKSQPPAAHASS